MSIGRKIGTLLLTLFMLLTLAATPVMAGEGGTKGPCAPGTLLEGVTLGEDVSWVAVAGFTPLPEYFAFEEGPPPMPPGQLLQFARSVGLC